MNKYSTSHPSNFSPYLCPQCKAKIPSYEGGHARYLSCGVCLSYFKYENNQFVKYLDYKKTVNIIIPIGTKGSYKNKKYQIVGALQVKESNAAYYWTEYVLKAEDGTYDFLSEYEGHWCFVKEIENFTRSKQTTTFRYKERDYTYFNYYKTLIVGAIGEFTWDLALEGKPTVKEYISPPMGLNHEYGNTTNKWFETEYLSKENVKSIFSLPSNFFIRIKNGPYSIEPFPVQIETYQLKRYAVMFLLAMLAIVFLVKGLANEKKVLSAEIPISSITVNSDSNNYVSNEFALASLTGTSAVSVKLIAQVDNNWIDVSFSMINQQSGQEYFFEEGVEYYSGYEGGSSWSEGSIEKEITLSEIPDGKYRISSKVAFREGTTLPKVFFVEINEGVTLWSNFFILTAIGLLIPVLIGLWENNFHSNKWSTSNLLEHE
jgi:hypothetical protein